MGDVRYGARPVDQVSNREVEATRNPIWSKAVTVVFRTDPDGTHGAAADRRGRPGDRPPRLRGRVVRGPGPPR